MRASLVDLAGSARCSGRGTTGPVRTLYLGSKRVQGVVAVPCLAFRVFPLLVELEGPQSGIGILVEAHRIDEAMRVLTDAEFPSGGGGSVHEDRQVQSLQRSVALATAGIGGIVGDTRLTNELGVFVDVEPDLQSRFCSVQPARNFLD